MTKLSVNINKMATLRNARGGNFPDILQVATDVQNFGASGITIHPRPDERHIRYADAHALKPIIHTEYNIEGNPIPKFIDLVLEIQPTQVTLVPDAEDAITSNSGWDTVTHRDFLSEVIQELKRQGIRTSIFVDPVPKIINGAVATGADCIELYTESYAKGFASGDLSVVKPFVDATRLANDLGLRVHAGHDLALDNIGFFSKNMPYLQEVSIGHALICESIYLGLENVIQMYLQRLGN